jgi:hypothetical protein
MPEVFSDFFVIWAALMGTMIAAFCAVVGPIWAGIKGIAGAFISCMPKPPAPAVGNALGGLVKSNSVREVSGSFYEQVLHPISVPWNLRRVSPVCCL